MTPVCVRTRTGREGSLMEGEVGGIEQAVLYAALRRYA
jgi:hypothetical protein